MKLSELVSYRKLLDSYDPGDLQQHLDRKIASTLHAIQHNDIQFPQELAKLEDTYQGITQQLARFSENFSSLRDQTQKLIDELQPGYFMKSYQLYEEMCSYDKPPTILARKLLISESAAEYVQGRIKMYTDWHRPGMIIRPADEEWIEYLVALDPLYIVDQDIELLQPAVERFNIEYRRRLRLYRCNEQENGHYLERLPDAQFRYCLAYNFFNYKPFEVLRGYLCEIFNKLVPGGTLAMTINNCDLPDAVVLCEQNYNCYQPGRMVLSLAQTLGFLVDQNIDLNSSCTWIELRKPGKSHSLRGGQALARVLRKHQDSEQNTQEPEQITIDNVEGKIYTNKQIKALRKQATRLGIVDNADGIAPEELERLIAERTQNT